jgi:hypothetical protein
MKIDKKQYIVLFGSFIQGIGYGIAWPVLHKELVSNISSRMISLEQVIAYLSIMIVSFYWNKIKDWFMKNYIRLETIESILLSVFYIYFLFSWNPIIFFMADVLYFSLVGGLLTRCTTTGRALLFPTTEEKINADANHDFIIGLSSIIGYTFSIFYVISLSSALVVFLISDLIRTFSKIWTYKKYKEYFLRRK